MNDFRTCAELDEVAEELALGTLSGSARALALAHVASCTRCRGLVDGLTEAGEAVLLLAPEEQPPLGFETRVAAEIRSASREARSAPRRWRRVAVAAAVAAAALVGVVSDHLVTATPTSAGVKVALAAADGGRATCRAVVIPGRPAQLVVTIDEPREQETSDYVVETEVGGHGPTENVGTLRLVDGHGVLSAPLSGAGADIRSVRVFQSGQLRYEARF